MEEVNGAHREPGSAPVGGVAAQREDEEWRS
jgi:hypothetical protein